MRLFKDFTGISRHPAAANASDRHRPRRRRCPLGLEQLEDRVALSTFVVTNLNDSGDGSLRQAILASNSSTDSSNEIDFAQGLSGTIVLTSGQLTIANNAVKLVGPGANVLSVSGNHASRVFEVASGATVTISGLTIENGRAGEGGGILNVGTLTVTDSVFSNNYVFEGASSHPGGGGVANIGTANILRSTFSGNISEGEGGGIYNDPSGTLTLDTSLLTGNGLLTVPGGGLWNDGTTTVSNSRFTGNKADNGGAIRNDGNLAVINNSILTLNVVNFGGGGIENQLDAGETLTVADSTIADNAAGFDGGGIDSRGGGGRLTVISSIIVGNSSGADGGGIFNLNSLMTVVGGTISGNSANRGGGLDNDADGVATVSGVTVSGNHALTLTTSSDGGGIANEGTLTVTASTLSDNSADSNGGGISNSGLLAIAGSTLSDNSAVEDGGGIFNTGGGLALAGVTIRRNSAAVGGGIFNTNGGVLAIVASDISDNSGGNLVDVT